jgi:TRAP-type C4-dicarboxylate transport system permease large subunit
MKECYIRAMDMLHRACVFVAGACLVTITLIISYGVVSMEAVSKSILVFYIPMVIVLLLVTYIPTLSLWLPHLVLD